MSRWIVAVGALVVLATMPLVLSEFYVTLLNYIGLASIVTIGLVLLTGVAGLTSFGQAAFVGIGAYTTAVLTTAYGLSPWLTLPISLLLTTAIALVIGFVTLRLSGHYLPLGTIAWGISIFFVFGNLEILGKYSGIADIPAFNLFGVSLIDGRQFYYPIWLTTTRGAARNTQSSGFARRTRDPRFERPRRHGRKLWCRHRQAEDHYFSTCGVVGEYFWMALRALPSLRQPFAVQHQRQH